MQDVSNKRPMKQNENRENNQQMQYISKLSALFMSVTEPWIIAMLDTLALTHFSNANQTHRNACLSNREANYKLTAKISMKIRLACIYRHERKKIIIFSFSCSYCIFIRVEERAMRLLHHHANGGKGVLK
jgi:hypothetical protein